MREICRSLSIVLALCVMTPVLASAQVGGAGDLRGQKTRTNFYRQVGGSCIYDRNGMLSYAPSGADCPKRENQSTDAGTKQVSSQLQAELDRYRQEHREISEALALLRETIVDREYKLATKQLDGIKVKIQSHKRREEKLYDRLVPSAPAAPSPAKK